MQGYEINSGPFSEAMVYSFELERIAMHNQESINSILAGMNPPSDLDISSYIYRIKSKVNNFTTDAQLTKNSITSIFKYVSGTDATLGATINDYLIENIAAWLAINNVSVDNSMFSNLTPEEKAQIRKIMLSFLYNGTTNYGGNQGAPYRNYILGDTEYARIIRRYFPEMSDEQVLDYLQSINQVGCGYTAVANYIFEGYIDKPEQYQRDFGFPMFYKNKDGEIVSSINYLVTDVYCNVNINGLTDNVINPVSPTTIGTINGYYYNHYRGDSETATGLSEGEQKSILNYERYKDANVNVKSMKSVLRNLPIDIPHLSDNFNNYSDEIKNSLKKGNVLTFNASNYTLYPSDANNHKITYVEPIVVKNGAHSMTITDVNDNGEFIISSWGERYVLDSDSVDHYFGLKEISFD